MDRPRSTNARLQGLAAALIAVTAVVAAAATGLAAAPVRSSDSYPGVVDVKAFLGYQHAATLGTGIVLDRPGEVITNNHVIRGSTDI